MIKLTINLNFYAYRLVVKYRKGRSKLLTGLYLENMDTSSRPGVLIFGIGPLPKIVPWDHMFYKGYQENITIIFLSESTRPVQEP